MTTIINTTGRGSRFLWADGKYRMGVEPLSPPAGPLVLNPADFGLPDFGAANPNNLLSDKVWNMSEYDALTDGAVVPDKDSAPSGHVWKENGTISGKFDNVLISTDVSKKRHDADTKRYSAIAGSGNSGFLAEPAAMPRGHAYSKGIYLSFWHRQEDNFPGDTDSSKIVRLWAVDNGTYVFTFWDNVKLQLSTTGPTGHTPRINMYDPLGNVAGQWVRYELWFDFRTPSASVLRGWKGFTQLVDGTEGNNTVTADCSTAPANPYVTHFGYDVTGSNYSAWSRTDIDLAETPKRFELTNHATWGSETHKEYQPINTWSASAPEIELFYGAHAATGALYLHHIDENNAAAGSPKLVRAA